MIEMLVSLAITMIMMLGVVTLFGVMTDSVSGSRALLETSDRLRACRNRLQADLQGATATMQPPLRPENDEGYFEIGEGPNFDGNNGFISLPTPPAGATLFGDTDDYLAFTVRSRGEPFVGKYTFAAAGTLESQVVEVVYFLAQSGNEPIIDATTTPPTRLFTLYRRVLLVAPGLGGPNLPAMPLAANDYYSNNDISARFVTTGAAPVMVANSLGDLTKPENRFAHYGVAPFPGTFPFQVSTIVLAATPPTTQPNQNAVLLPLGANRAGEDVLLTNVLAFDVQVFDPGAPVFITGGVSVEPRDPAYAGQFGVSAPVAFGAYADLGYRTGYVPAAGAPPALFNLAPAARSGIIARPFTYDTWSLHYENDGFPQPSTNVTFDLGTNGLDDNGDGVVDDLAEFDTLPPYSAQLRGVRITVRVYEPSSQQVREIVVMQDFLPD